MGSIVIEVAKPAFPYIIDEGEAEFESFTMIERTDISSGDKALFYIVNGDLRIDSGVDSHAVIRVVHSSARTRSGGDRAHLAYMPLESAQFIHASAGSYTFSAWLAAPPQFYPAGDAADQDPFLAAANGKPIEYEYLPPYVMFGRALALPTKVKITVVHGAAGERWFQDLVKDHNRG
jgi:hypothetical protein